MMFFFTRTSETIDEIGIASTCIKTIENSVFAGFLIRFRPQNGMLYKGFSKYFFRCFIPRVFFVKEMNLVTRASLSQELLKRLPVLLPDFDEQIDIAGFLDAETSRIDMLIDKYLRQIELLKEYKTALISEVVTGKVDVRDEKTQKL
jgi:type I restriction enzyme S subunit